MHHWHSGQPPRPYLWVLRWHAAHGPTWSPGQVSAEGSGSVTGGAGVVIVGVLFWAAGTGRLKSQDMA